MGRIYNLVTDLGCRTGNRRVHRVGAGTDIGSGNDSDLRAQVGFDRGGVLDVDAFHDQHACFFFHDQIIPLIIGG